MPQNSGKQQANGYAALRHAAAFAERNDAGRILVTGADRASYLQGLLTNDIAALTTGAGCYAAMLTAHGRMLTDMRVLELGDAILLDVPRAVTTQIRDHLDRFIFSEDAQVADVTASRAEIGVYGPGAGAALATCGASVADAQLLYSSWRGSVGGVDARIALSDAYGVRGYDLVVDASARERVAEALSAAGVARASAGDLEVIRIESGVPRFGADMDTDTIPLEAGIEDRAISRTKGCYVGQEVIVRVLDRGHGRVARRLVGLALDPSAPVPPRGATITAADREVGNVTSAVRSPSLNRPIALGYVRRDVTEPGTRVEVDSSGPAVVSALPFL